MTRWRSPAASPMSARSSGRSTPTPSNGASPSRKPGITSDWLLRLDADYMVEPALRDEWPALAPAVGDGGLRDRLHLLHRRPAVAGLALSGAAGPVPPRPRTLRAGRPYREAAASTDPSRRIGNRLLHDDRKSLERWLQSQSRYQAQEAEKLTTRPWSELSWPDRLRRTRVLGPIAVAVHCLLVKGLIFDGTAGLLYTAQRVTADLILSMHLLRRDLDRLLTARLPDDLRPRAERLSRRRRRLPREGRHPGRRRRGRALPPHQALGRLSQRIDPLLPDRGRHSAWATSSTSRSTATIAPTAGASSPTC